MKSEYSSSFYLDCIQKTLSNVYFQDQFTQLKFFSDKKYRLILLYELMKDHYLNAQGDTNKNFLPTKETFYQLVSPYVSRLSMAKFIDRMVETGVLIKKNHSQDKRKQILSPSVRLIEEFEAMHQQREQELQKKTNKFLVFRQKN